MEWYEEIKTLYEVGISIGRKYIHSMMKKVRTGALYEEILCRTFVG